MFREVDSCVASIESWRRKPYQGGSLQAMAVVGVVDTTNEFDSDVFSVAVSVSVSVSVDLVAVVVQHRVRFLQ